MSTQTPTTASAPTAPFNGGSPLTPEQIQSFKSQIPTSSQPIGNDLISSLKAGTLGKPADTKPGDNLLSGTTDKNLSASSLFEPVKTAVTGAVNNAGAIGSDINLPGTQGKNSYAQKSYDSVLAQHTDLANQLTKRISSDKAAGKDTTGLQTALTNLNASLPNRNDFKNSGSPEKVLGDAIKTGVSAAALITAPLTGGESEAVATAADAGIDAAEGVSTASKIAATAAKGAGAGAAFGGAQGAGNALSKNENAGQVAKSTAINAAIGAGAGGVLAGGIEAAPEISDAFEKSSKAPTGVADATPAYNKNMVSQNVMNENGEIVPRINAEGSGLTGERPVTSSAKDVAAGKELDQIPNYPKNGTALQKSLSARLALGDEAESMRNGLQTEDSENPIDSKTQTAKVDELVKSNLPEDIQNRIGYQSKDSVFAKLGGKEVPQTETAKLLAEARGDGIKFPKTPAGRYYQSLLDALKNYDGSREGILDLRQAADDAFDSNGGNYAHGSDSHAELSETHKDIRNALNKQLSDVSENTDTTASLKKQSNLYHGIDVLNEKAAAEAPSSLSRFMQKNPSARMVNRMVLRRAINEVL